MTVTVTDPGLDNNFATPGDNLTVTRTFTVTVAEVNDPPTLDGIADPVAINEDAGQQTVNLAGITAGSGETQPLQVTATSNNTSLIPNPTVTYTTANATGSLAYTPVANAFGTAVVTVTVTDGGVDGNLATAGDNGIFTRTFTVTVNPVNDAPSFAASNPPTVLEDAGLQTVPSWATFSAGPASEAGQTVLSYTVSNVSNPVLFSALPAVAVSGTLTYTPADNAFGSSTFDVVVQDSGGVDNSGDDTSDAQTFTITVTPVNDAPVAVAKLHTTHSGIGLTINAASHTGELKEGATDVDPHDPFSELTVQLVGTPTPTNATVTLVSASDGSFYFEPPGGLSGNGSASFQFRVCDNGDVGLGLAAACSAAVTATFNITGPDLWFIDDTDAAGCGVNCNGTRSKPLVGLNNAALTGRGNGDRIFVFTGTYGTGLTLLTNEHLIGQGSSGTFDTVLGVTVPGNGTLDTRPALGGTRPQLNGTVTVGGSSVVRGLNIVTSGATGLSGGAVTGVTVNEASVSATNATAVNLARWYVHADPRRFEQCHKWHRPQQQPYRQLHGDQHRRGRDGRDDPEHHHPRGFVHQCQQHLVDEHELHERQPKRWANGSGRRGRRQFGREWRHSPGERGQCRLDRRDDHHDGAARHQRQRREEPGSHQRHDLQHRQRGLGVGDVYLEPGRSGQRESGQRVPERQHLEHRPVQHLYHERDAHGRRTGREGSALDHQQPVLQ